MIKESIMKKWHIITGSIILFIALIAAIFSLTYKYYIVPKFVEPFAQQATEKLRDDSFLDALYSQATQLHNDGTLSDDIYSSFLTAYNRHNRKNDDAIYDSLGESYEDEAVEAALNTKRASYASTKVGIDLIETNDGESKGKANSTYSAERNSNRTKAEDIVEAEKKRAGLQNADATEKPTETPEDFEAQALKKLMDNMTTSEANRFRVLMQKLDINILRSYSDGKNLDELKAYLHSNLNNDEYRELVNLGYKYMNLFIE